MNDIDAIYSFEDYKRDMESQKDLLTYRHEPLQDRVFIMYKHYCLDCGWESYRSESLSNAYCSKCGSTKQPLITKFEHKTDTKKAKEETEALIKRYETGWTCSSYGGMAMSCEYMFMAVAVGVRLCIFKPPTITPADRFY